MAAGISLRAGPAPGLPTPELVEALAERPREAALASVSRLLQRED